MRPTLDYLVERFDYFNQLCFDGELQRPPIKLNTRYATMGQTCGECCVYDDGTILWKNLRIEISVRRDLPEYEYIDTLVHEMIHYYVMTNNLQDDSPHGTLFRQKMEEITMNYGIRITIAFDPSDEEMVNTRTRNRYVVTAESNDGHMLVAVVARNKVFQFWDYIPKMDGVSNVHWYVSDRQIFEKFPVAVSPRLFNIDADKLHHYLTGAKELENTGEIIRIKQNT